MDDVLRDHLASVVRNPNGDLAEACLIISAMADDEVNVPVQLLRVDAIADGLRARSGPPTEPEPAAAALAGYLAGELGFTGDEDDYHNPANGSLATVLDRQRGLPITLVALWVAVARRVRIPAFPIALPGHVVMGVGGDEEPVILDPFHAGVRRTDMDLADIVERSTAGRAEFTRSMVRPASNGIIVRRVLDNLTRDYLGMGDARNALWTVQAKAVVPGERPSDHRDRGELLLALGRFDEAAAALDEYVRLADEADDAEEIAVRSRRARARMN